jgi:hypothetical protein
MKEMKIKTKKATKPRHPEMVSHDDALDIPTFSCFKMMKNN